MMWVERRVVGGLVSVRVHASCPLVLMSCRILLRRSSIVVVLVVGMGGRVVEVKTRVRTIFCCHTNTIRIRC